MILSALQSAALRVAGRRPGTFFGAGQNAQLEQELCDLVNEVAIDVAKYQDWQALTKIANISGGTEIDLPDDYDRMILNADIQQSANWVWGYYHISDINEYIYRTNSGWAPYPGGWILFENKLHFSPAPTGNAQFPYISANWALDMDGTPKPQFTADTDSFALPERLLALGLVWRWREMKKLDYTGDPDAFIKALDEYAGKDAGSSIIRFNGTRRWPNASIPYMGVAY
jgi:hypothetical protein